MFWSEASDPLEPFRPKGSKHACSSHFPSFEPARRSGPHAVRARPPFNLARHAHAHAKKSSDKGSGAASRRDF